MPDIAAWCGISFGDKAYANPLNMAHHLYSDESTEIINLVIPDGVSSIGDFTFRNCTSLNSVIIPNSVTSIGECAFDVCSSLTSVNISDGVTRINHSAFFGCGNLTSITIPEGVTSIGGNAFDCCGALSIINIPNSVTSIGDEAFKGTAWYNNQPDGLVYAGKVAYKYKGTMPSNTHITIEEGTLGIGAYAFYQCSGLTSVTIPEGVTNIT